MKLLVDPTLPRHPKLGRLAALLEVVKAEALGYLLTLWLWVLEVREGGDLTGILPAELAIAAGWPGDPEKFVDGLASAGFLDRKPILRIHNWLENQGRLVQKREAARRRQQKRRDRVRLTRDNGVTSREASRVTGVTPVTQVTRGSTARQGKEGKGEAGEADVKKSPAPVQIPPELVGLDLYRRDERLCRRWAELIAAWRVGCPGVDIETEVARAHAWEVENPAKRKTNRARFLGSWLRRAQDSPRPANGKPAVPDPFFGGSR